MLKKIFVLGIFFSLLQPVQAQTDSLAQHYRVDHLRTGLVAGAGIVLHQLGLAKQRRAPLVAESTILNLRPADVNGFDRVALRQDYLKRREAAKISDRALNLSLILPAALFIDRKIRREWVDVTLLYLEAQALSNNLYVWGPFGPTFVDRMRPVAYYDGVPMEERTDNKTRQSFFSGHVSSVSTSSFLMAKVYCDFHPEIGAQKWLVYGLATVPPAFVAVYRIKALRHFPTDVLVGGAIGAASGVIIPQLHKKWQGKVGLSAIYQPENKGLALSLRW